MHHIKFVHSKSHDTETSEESKVQSQSPSDDEMDEIDEER
jgi:hypothetical protein